MAPREKLTAKIVNPRQLEPDWRLALVRRKEQLGNIKQACEEFGVSRPTFYKIHKVYLAHGAKALEDENFTPKPHPRTTPLADVEEVLWQAQKHPTKSTKELIEELRYDGVSISATTINKILREQGMGRAYRRRPSWKMVSPSHLDASAVQLGQKLCQFVFLLGSRQDLGTVYVHAVVDLQSSWVWAGAQIGRRSEDAIALLKDEVLPCYQRQGLRPLSIETLSSRLFCAPADPADLLERREWKQRPENAATYQKIERDIEELQEQGYTRYRATREIEWKRRGRPRSYGEIGVDNSEQERINEALRHEKWDLAEKAYDAVGWRQYTRFLYGREIEHLTVTGRGTGFNEWAQSFHDALMSEFFTSDIRAASMSSLDQLQSDLSIWLKFYNDKIQKNGKI